MGERQYLSCFDEPSLELGRMTSYGFRRDPRHLGFTLARYKFVAKMLSGKTNVAEIGCGDGFASAVVKQEVTDLHIFDFDGALAEEAKRQTYNDCDVHDITEGPLPFTWDAIYAIDVIEHIPLVKQAAMLKHICDSLVPDGVFIVGTPSFESQRYASQNSKIGHVCCYSHDSLREFLKTRFANVFMFGMNDEVLHVGYGPMCHYLFAVCV